jgi:uncharacterized membrane protein
LTLDIAVLVAALGITTLELVEAAAVALALYGQTKQRAAFGCVALGVLVVLLPALLLGRAIALLPTIMIKLVGGALLLYFGLRLTKSARRSVLRARRGELGGGAEPMERGLFYTGFSVGAIEAFEASIVLVGLLPNNYSSTLIGLAAGAVIVIVATYLLRMQVRKVKQANMKVVVSALLLSFSTLWFGEIFFPSVTDLILIPVFLAFAFVVHWIANRPTLGLAQKSQHKEKAA